jgi:hypothetical protein
MGEFIGPEQCFPGTIMWTRRYTIEPATREHILAIGPKLREGDVAEITGLGGNVRKALWRGFRNSIWCRVATVDGELAAIWGLCVAGRLGIGPLSGKAVPWLLTTAAIERIPVTFVRHARREVAAMRQLYPALENHVAADYAQAVKFLHLIGFTVDPPEPVGLGGTPFCRFHIGC